MYVVLAPDSFKGSLSAREVARSLAEGWRSVRPGDELVELPLADGGEGTLATVESAVGGSRRRDAGVVTGPDHRPVQGEYLELPDGTALVELAMISGLPLMERLDPLRATTRGLGEVLHRALTDGSRRLQVTLGGSATTDAATGALRTLGLGLYGARGEPLNDGGGELTELDRISTNHLLPPPQGGVDLLTDVENPLLGPCGAAAVFGPQKGADAAAIEQLEAGLARLAELAGGDPDAAGAGAAGGAGYGLATFWGATLRLGSEVVGELVGLERHLTRADLAITGEGAFDRTSLTGKIPGFVLNTAREKGADTAVVAGTADGTFDHDVTTLEGLSGGIAAAMADPCTWLKQAAALIAVRYDQ